MIKLKAFIISIVLVLITLLILNETYIKKIDDYYKVKDNSIRYNTSYEKYKSYDILTQNITSNTLVLLGSSELTATINEEYHPKKIFNYNDFNIMQIGVGNSQNIIHAATLGSIGNNVKNNKVVMIESIQWFDNKSGILKDAFLSIEDKQFYSHHGLNFKGIARAVITTFLKGRATQGGSSITQQLAKNAFLTPEKTFSRKVKEAILTYQMERTYTKDEILERYLNEIYYGSGSYGIKNAAEQYFRKDVKDLNVAEAALLAGIPNRPTKYDPNRNLENALHRQKIIRKEM